MCVRYDDVVSPLFFGFVIFLVVLVVATLGLADAGPRVIPSLPLSVYATKSREHKEPGENWDQVYMSQILREAWRARPGMSQSLVGIVNGKQQETESRG